jgi:hypothetical protein
MDGMSYGDHPHNGIGLPGLAWIQRLGSMKISRLFAKSTL